MVNWAKTERIRACFGVFSRTVGQQNGLQVALVLGWTKNKRGYIFGLEALDLVSLAVQTLSGFAEVFQLDPDASGPILCWHHNTGATSVQTSHRSE